MTEQTPLTAAGQAFIDSVVTDGGHMYGGTPESLTAIVRGIEAEARMAAALAIETRARLQDALDALEPVIEWEQGGLYWTPTESWHRKARSGVVGLRAALTEQGDET